MYSILYCYLYQYRSNCASFLILRQNVTFQTGNFQSCVTLRKLIFYRYVTRISGWSSLPVTIELRQNRDMAETSLVVRDGNGNRNSSPTSVFSVIQGYHVYQRTWTPHVGEKATTRKRTRPIRFKRGKCKQRQFLPGIASLHRNVYYTTS